MHIELVSASATAPGSSGAAATALAGDSLIVKNGVLSRGVQVLSAWQTNQVAGFGQIVNPSGHDTTRGYRAGVNGFQGAIISPDPCILPLGIALDVQPQETLSLTIAGSAVAGDVEQLSMLVRYGDLPGVSQRLLTAGELMHRMEKITTVETSIASTAGPSYGTAIAINAQSDLLRANRDYAILGMSSRTPVHSGYIYGPDTGNVKVGIPMTLRQELQATWFMMLSRAFGDPLIPVINSGNKASTFIGVATDENAGTFITTLYLALLK